MTTPAPRNNRRRLTWGAAAALATLAACGLAARRGAAGAERYLWPVQGLPPRLTGVMGDARADHLHAGIDISLMGRVGVTPIVSVADGELLRLRTSDVGYGNAVYIRMADRQVAVYAHLDHFSPRLEALAADIRRRTGRFHIDYYVEDWEEPFLFRRGETIAYGGRTGTGAPHLHFELRDNDQVNLNPLMYGMAVDFEGRPAIAEVRLTPLDAAAAVDGRGAAKVLRFGRRNSGPPVRVRGRVGAAVDASAPQQRRGPALTPYRLELRADGREFFATTFDRFGWVDKRLTLAQCDFGERGRRFLRLYNPYPVAIPFFSAPQAGTLDQLGVGSHRVEILAIDAAGRAARAQFAVTVETPLAAAAAPPPASDERAVFNSQTVEVDGGRGALEFGADSLFAPARATIGPAAPPREAGMLWCMTVHSADALVRRPFTVRFRWDADEPAPARLVVARDDGRGGRIIGGTIDGASRTVSAETVEFGSFCLARRESPPVIEQVRRLRDGRLAFRAAADDGAADVQVWQGEQRAIVEFQPRSGEAAVWLDGEARDVAIVVRDRAGNVGRWFGSLDAL